MDFCPIRRLITNSQLEDLSEEYSLLDDSEIPLLIRLLWDIRCFEEAITELPLHRLQILIVHLCEIDNAISQQILELYVTSHNC